MKIGLTQRVLYHKGRAYDSIEHGWYSYLKDHTLTFIPNRLDQDFEQLSAELDVLIITGGDDSAIRHLVELKIATNMMKLVKPIIGICHGSFLLTDILGGVIAPVDNHYDIVHNTWYQGQKYLVNSRHNQTITKLHTSGKPLAIDDHGNIEAWIDGNIAGITWHPERMDSPWLPDEIQQLINI